MNRDNDIRMKNDFHDQFNQSQVSAFYVPIWNKLCLTIEEAAAYSHIGEHRLREVANNPLNADLILRIGNKTVFKRPAFESYIMGLQRI